jgi:hypothetical protein
MNTNHGYPQVPQDDYIHRIKRRAHDLGLAISGTGVRNDFVAAMPPAANAMKRLCGDRRVYQGHYS